MLITCFRHLGIMLPKKIIGILRQQTSYKCFNYMTRIVYEFLRSKILFLATATGVFHCLRFKITSLGSFLLSLNYIQVRYGNCIFHL